MENKGYYAVIPADIRYAEIPNGAKLLYGEITALCNDKGFCWATNSYFSSLYGVDSRTITRWINNLKSNGFIETEIIYKENSKEIDKRIISITPLTKLSIGGDKNVYTPIDKNVRENNTNINNTKSNANALPKSKPLSGASPDECTTEQLAQELKEQAEDLKCQQIVNEFNRVCTKLPKVMKLSPQRKRKIKARLKVFSEVDIYQAFMKTASSRFLSGSSGWKASFDWFFENDNNIQKVLEGNYDNSNKTKERPPDKFNNFKQRSDNLDALEKKLLGY